MPKASPLVHLFDCHVYIFRSYFVMPEMTAPDGRPTQAAYGFANTLIRYLKEEEPTHVAACFDFAMTSWRNERFPPYKSSRGDEVPEDLEPQFEMCKRAADALGFPIAEAQDYEADDVLGTFVDRLLSESKARARVLTSDKDLSQLVTEDGRIALYDLAKEKHMDADGVREKFGVDPAQIPDYLALVGDKVDDLPGVPGVGAKSAAAVLGAFASIEQIPADPELWADVEVRGAKRLAERIEEHRAQALEIRELATVVRKVPGLWLGLDHLAWQGADRDAFAELAEELGWGEIVNRVPRWA